MEKLKCINCGANEYDGLQTYCGHCSYSTIDDDTIYELLPDGLNKIYNVWEELDEFQRNEVKNFALSLVKKPTKK